MPIDQRLANELGVFLQSNSATHPRFLVKVLGEPGHVFQRARTEPNLHPVRRTEHRRHLAFARELLGIEHATRLHAGELVQASDDDVDEFHG